MNTVPKMTKIQAHFEESNLEIDLSKDASGFYLNEVARYAWMNWMAAYSFGREHQANIANKATEIALADQSAQPEIEFITAEQAQELGAGNAEFLSSIGDWHICLQSCSYSKLFKYRAIKQAQPEPVDKHAGLRAEYAKQAAEGTAKFYLWEFLYLKTNQWHMIPVDEPPQFINPVQYRYTDISCYVSKDGEPAIRMLRTDAQELQAKLGDTVEWFAPLAAYSDKTLFTFSSEGTYNYRTKATIKLDGKMVTHEQAEAEWEAKKDTHTCFEREETASQGYKRDCPRFYTWKENKTEYKFFPKEIKTVKWSDLPVGAAVSKLTEDSYIFVGLTRLGNAICVSYCAEINYHEFRVEALTLALADQQPWLAVQDEFVELKGLICELRYGLATPIATDDTVIAYRIIGLQDGWKMEGNV